MRKQSYLLFMFALALTSLGSGCAGAPPNPGFRIKTAIKRVGTGGLPVTTPHLLVSLSGNMVAGSDYPGISVGTVTSFIGGSGLAARHDVKGGRATATWDWKQNSGPCTGISFRANGVVPGDEWTLTCDTFGVGFSFYSTPSYIDASAPPAKITVHGSGFTSAGGMPVIEYYNNEGTLADSRQATEIAGDGTWASGPTPNLSSSTSGQYVLRARNADGTYLGDGAIEMYSPYEPPPPEPCPPCDPRMDCMPCNGVY